MYCHATLAVIKTPKKDVDRRGSFMRGDTCGFNCGMKTLLFCFLGLSPVWGRRIEFSLSTFSGLVLLHKSCSAILSAHVSLPYIRTVLLAVFGIRESSCRILLLTFLATVPVQTSAIVGYPNPMFSSARLWRPTMLLW